MVFAVFLVRESLLLRVMVERGGIGFLIQGVLRGLFFRDLKQLIFISFMMLKLFVFVVKIKLQSDEINRVRVLVEEKESLSISLKKDRGMVMNSEMSVFVEINVKL